VTALLDLRLSVRALRRAPRFTLTAILLLATAMAANTAVFTVVEALLLRPLPYADAARLCVLWKSVPARHIEWDWTSYPTLRDWREQSHAFADLAYYLRPEGSQVLLDTRDGPEPVQAAKVSDNFFDLIGSAPLLGRTFTSAGSDANPVVVSYGFWQEHYGADRNVVGRSLRLDDRTTTIIGVMPPDFQLPYQAARLWLRVAADPRWPTFQTVRIADAFGAVARLKRGIALSQARADMDSAAARLAREHAPTDSHLGIRVLPIEEQIVRARARRALVLLAAAVLCVVLIACSNIAGLLTARTYARRHEFAVQAALGAGRSRLLRQVAAENLMLCLAGGAAGLVLAWQATQALLAWTPMEVRSAGVGINVAVLGFTFVLCSLLGIAFGWLAAAHSVPRDPQQHLYGGRSISAVPAVHRLQGLLVALQFALAVTLLTGAGLLLRSFLLLDAVRPGFDTSRLVSLQIRLPESRYDDPIRRQWFFAEAVRRIGALPGVRGAAIGAAVMESFRDHVPNQNLIVEGRPTPDTGERHARNIVNDDYFRMLGVPLRDGRSFSTLDTTAAPHVAVINETMARRFWPYTSALGRRFKQVLPGTDSPWITVIGVAADVIYNRDGVTVPTFYLSTRQWPFFTDMQLTVRTAVDPVTLVPAIRSAVHAIDPSVPRFNVDTVAHELGEQDRPRRFNTALIAIFSALSLALSALGIYGLVRYAVEQRTREIGIRLALGASLRSISTLVLRRGLSWAMIGVAFGMAGAWTVGRILAGWLFGIGPLDPVTLAATIALLTIVLATACGLPARGATAIDPAVTLRQE
jgi:putative ABC transport system permease protein